MFFHYSSSTVINIFWMNENLNPHSHMPLRHWKHYLRKPPPFSKFNKHCTSKFTLVTYREEPNFKRKWKQGSLVRYQPSKTIVYVDIIPPVPRWMGLFSRTVTRSFSECSHPSRCCPLWRGSKAKPTAYLTRTPTGSPVNVWECSDDKQAGAPLRQTQNTLQKQTQRRNNNLKEKTTFQFPDHL